MTAVRVHVTQQDIDLGLPMRRTRCPVALACQRAGFPAVQVHTTSVRFRPGLWVTLPVAARRFIEDFDLHQWVRPFEFDLCVPDDLLAGTQ